MEYEKLFKALWEAKIRYLICGGLAVNIYGIPRMTADIDLLLDFESKNLEEFEKTLKEISYKASVPVPIRSLVDEKTRKNLKQEKNMIAYSFYSSIAGAMTIDVLIDTPLSFAEFWDKREVRKMNDYEVNLAGLEHLIELKKYSNRAQDKEDVILLSKLLGKQ